MSDSNPLAEETKVEDAVEKEANNKANQIFGDDHSEKESQSETSAEEEQSFVPRNLSSSIRCSLSRNRNPGGEFVFESVLEKEVEAELFDAEAEDEDASVNTKDPRPEADPVTAVENRSGGETQPLVSVEQRLASKLCLPEKPTRYGVLNSCLFRERIEDRWNAREIGLFESTFVLHGKSFSLLSTVIGTKTTKEVIDFYYVWKKTKKYKIWKTEVKSS